MAEVVGLVIGGVNLASLLDQCISIINYIDSGISCGDAYQDAALMLTLLGGRLSRWEQAYKIIHTDGATEEDGENAEHWLKQIHKRLQEAEKLGERYTVEASSTNSPSDTTRSRAVSSLVCKLQDKLSKKGDGPSFGKRARWALLDQSKMDGLIDKLDKLITNLERLSPDLHDKRIEIARADAAAVTGVANAEAYSEALEALKAAALKVDRDFNVSAASTSNVYRNIEVSDKAMVNNANYYSEDWAKAGGVMGKGGGHTYEGIRISGEARVQNGDMFGGKNVFHM